MFESTEERRDNPRVKWRALFLVYKEGYLVAVKYTDLTRFGVI